MVDKICIQCGKEKLHYAKGYCRNCYYKLKIPPEKRKEYFNKWKEKNPDYFKEYYLKQKEKRCLEQSEQ